MQKPISHFLPKVCTYMCKPPNYSSGTRNEQNWQHHIKNHCTMHPSVMLCTYSFLMFVLFNCSTIHFRWSYYCSCVQGCSPLLCDSNQWLRLPSDLSLPPLNYYVQSAASYFHFQHRVERGLLNRKLMKVTVLLRKLRESMRKENHCFAHERRIRLKLPSCLI